MKKSYFIVAALFSFVSLAHAQSDPKQSSSASSSPELSAFLVPIETARSAPTISTVMGDVVGNPVVGPILVAAAAYFSVPPQFVAGLAALAAEGQAQSSAQRHGRQDVFTIKPPRNYNLCAVRLALDSIRPQRNRRPRVIAFGSPEEFRFEVNHQIQNIGEGGSKVKVKAQFALVRKDVSAEYADKCFPAGKTSSVIGTCRGGGCNRPMNGTIWYSGH